MMMINKFQDPNTVFLIINRHFITWVVSVSSVGVHSACLLDCGCTDYIVEVLKLGGLQRREDLWQDLKVRDK